MNRKDPFHFISYTYIYADIKLYIVHVRYTLGSMCQWKKVLIFHIKIVEERGLQSCIASLSGSSLPLRPSCRQMHFLISFCRLKSSELIARIIFWLQFCFVFAWNSSFHFQFHPFRSWSLASPGKRARCHRIEVAGALLTFCLSPSLAVPLVGAGRRDESDEHFKDKKVFI